MPKKDLINATADSIAKGLKNATWRGDHWTASCPTDNHVNGDRSAGLRIAEGDKVPVVVACAKCSQDEIFDRLTDLGLWAPKGDGNKRPNQAKRKPPQRPAGPTRAELQAEKRRTRVTKHAGVKATYEYVNADGEVVFEVWRTVVKGEKSFEQHILVDGKTMKAGPEKEERILYNLPAILAAPESKIVFIVEGEKAVDRATKLGILATCHPGGAGTWAEQFSEPLRGRKVIILPDNDTPGRKHAHVVGQALQGIAATVGVLDLPDLPEKGDFYDWTEAGGTKESFIALIKDSARVWAPYPEFMADQAEPETPEEPDQPEDQAEDPPWGGEYEPQQQDDEETYFGFEDILAEAPFTVLGYDDGEYFYLSNATRQVITLSPSAHTQSNLLTLAPLGFWEGVVAAGGKTGFDTTQAANLLFTAAHSKGLFSPDRIRGRGAWWDDKRVVVHAGDRLFVDGVMTEITKMRSGFTYPLAHALDLDIANPLTATEAKRFLDGVRMMTWASDLDSLLAAGWCVNAHIGGILTWRPHIWIIGAKGSGKTFFMERFLKPVLGENQAGGQDGFVGESTAAGIRQTIGCDALPVVLDEAEGENNRAVQRLQEILALARQSSSGTGKIVKGTSGGSSLAYQVRSCFAFSSINASIVQASDQSRITVLELKPGPHKHTVADLTEAAFTLFEDDYASRFFARAVAKAPMIREAARVFATCAAIMFREQRAGDQYGTLIAGAWSLVHDHAPSLAEAKEWLGQFDWEETRGEVAGQDDAEGAISRLMATTIRVDTSHGARDHTIAELVEAAQGHGDLAAGVAEMALNRSGLKTHAGGLFVANSGPAIEKLFKDTPWSVNWSKVLVRLPGAEKTSPTSFGSRANQKKSVRIPISVLTGTG